MSENIPIVISMMDFPIKTNQKIGILTGGRICSLSPAAPQGDGKATTL